MGETDEASKKNRRKRREEEEEEEEEKMHKEYYEGKEVKMKYEEVRFKGGFGSLGPSLLNKSSSDACKALLEVKKRNLRKD